jgi:hypothetical protein
MLSSEATIAELDFQKRVAECWDHAQKLLNHDKDTVEIFSKDIVHCWDDKFSVTSEMTNLAILSYLNTFKVLGLTSENLQQLRSWYQTNNVYMRVEVGTQCEYVREVVREVDDAVRHVSEIDVGARFTISSTVVKTITEHSFLYKSSVRLIIYSGADATKDVIELTSRSSALEIVQLSKFSPYPAKSAKNFDFNLGWLVSKCSPEDSNNINFMVDRAHQKCFTATNNVNVHDAVNFFTSFANTAKELMFYIRTHIFDVYLRRSKHPKASQTAFYICQGLFVPVLPAVIKRDGTTAPSGSIQGIVRKLSEEHYRCLESVRLEQLPRLSEDSLYSVVEGVLVTFMSHLISVYELYVGWLNKMENMIFAQLTAAVGKSLDASDFNNCYRHHARKVFTPLYAPKPFSFAVRRSNVHSSEGTFSIEESYGDSVKEPICTFSTQLAEPDDAPMKFPLNSSTVVTFTGERHVHGWLRHAFTAEPSSTTVMEIRAKQFSNFIVMLGTIPSPTVFDPKYAFIVQNNDHLTVPLEMETIPTAQQFKKAIVSISEEQQRFAKAYRSMQLEATLFGVLVIQIKPNLEKVMRLPTHSLAKEIQLTQTLLKLMMKYQIPSDLLAYDPNTSTSVTHRYADRRPCTTSLIVGAELDRLPVVKDNAVKMTEMIRGCEEFELEETQRQFEFGSASICDTASSASRSSIRDEASQEFGDDPYVSSVGRGHRRPSLAQRVWNSFFGCTADGSVVERGSMMCMMKCEEVADTGSRDRYASEFGEDDVDYNGMQCDEDECDDRCKADDGLDIISTSVPEGPPQISQLNEQLSNQMEELPSSGGNQIFDLTAIPAALDKRLEEFDVDSAVHSTIIRPKSTVMKREQKSLLGEPFDRVLNDDELDAEKQAAFILLDSLSKSGGLILGNTALHVVVAATHCFDANLMDSVAKENINPVERVDRSAVLMASVTHRRPPRLLIEDSQIETMLTHSPNLLQLTC